VHGVRIGFHTYSLRDLRYEAVVPAMRKVGLGECELWSMQVEPTRSEVVDIAKWRSTASMDFFTGVREKFNRAGIDIYAYNPTFGGPDRRSGGAAGPPPSAPPAPITDEEIDRTFQMAKALGAKTINSRVPPELARRIAPFAGKHKMVIGIFSLSADADLLAMSKYFRYDLDIGDYTHLGHDALKFVQDNHDQLTDIHLKDCKFKGASVPFGQGDTPMKEILQFLKQKRSQIRAHIDCDYPGTGTSVEEVQKCYDYVKGCFER